MGGLVIKKAYIIAKETPTYSALADRVRAMYFIATPHQGSDHAATLSKLFRTSPSLRPYLNDLQKNSQIVENINKEFPDCSQDLLLRSFYESRPLSIPGIGKRLIVEKNNATLFYPNERSELLNGDHRSICKFDTPEDSNYIIIYNALASTIETITSSKTAASSLKNVESLASSEIGNRVKELLGSFEVQEDDLYRVTTERVNGTCEWLSESVEFDEWVFSEDYKMLWLRGPPAAGKSFLAGYAVEQLVDSGKKPCYYFFTHGDKSKSSITTFLLSMACQIAVIIPDVATHVEKIALKDPGMIRAGDYRTIWRKLWTQGILRESPEVMENVVWVVDAVDECRNDGELLKLLSQVQAALHIKILVTSRTEIDDYDPPPRNAIHFSLDMEDTQRDIAAYISEHSPSLEHSIREVILNKSNGCFFWAILVLQRLKSVHGLQARLKAVQSEPPGMENLYSRILVHLPYPELSRSILTWIVCCIRPLTVDELQYALPEFREESSSIAINELISHRYNDLLYIDRRNQVRPRHSTVTDFLLRHDINDNPERLTIDRSDGHRNIALTCIGYLNGPEMGSKSRRKLSVTPISRSPFVEYAAHFMYEHLNRTSALDNDIFAVVAAFLQSTNLLTWIEYLASRNAMETLLQTAQALKDFLRRKSKRDLLLGDDVVVVDRWAADLVRLVTKFGRQLLQYPQSIFDLIPPFCPTSSAPYEQFARDRLGISVLGLSASTWDDCICTVAPSERKPGHSGEPVKSSRPRFTTRKRFGTASQAERLRSIASTDRSFAIGTSMGRISIFNDRTCLEDTILEQSMTVTQLQFASRKPLLVSTSNRKIYIWNTETWKCEWEVKIAKESMSLAFADDDQILLVALRNNHLLVLDLINRTQREVDWAKRLEERYGTKFRSRWPARATFKCDIDTLALVYRGQDIVVWNYEDGTQRLYNHSHGLTESLVDPMVQVQSLAFSNLTGSSLLVASYSVGDLVLFDTNSEPVKARISTSGIYANLTSSPDGRTFAGAATDGSIELYDFETLRRLFRIQSEDQGITVLAFTADSTRLLDIRGDGHSCRVWEPPALHRREIEMDSLREPSLYSQESYDNIVDRNDEHLAIITALATDDTGEFFFVGKDDATVSVYDAKTGVSLQKLFAHGTTVLELHYNELSSTLLSVDTAGSIIVHHVQQHDLNWQATTLFTLRDNGSGIQQAMFNHDGTQIMICVDDEASIYSVKSGERFKSTVKCDRSAGFAWAVHPSNRELLVLVSRMDVRFFSWKMFEELDEHLSFELGSHMPSELRVTGAMPMLNGSMLGLLDYSTHGASDTSFVGCIEIPHTLDDPKSLACLGFYGSLSPQVKYLAGSYRGRQVFVSTDGWICSASAEAFRGEVNILYHFMPPTNWLRTIQEAKIAISKSGDVLFSVYHEVAVVKRGLERSFDVHEG